MDNRLETTNDHYKKAFNYVEANKEHNRKIVLNLPLTEEGCIGNLSVITGMDFVANKRDTDLVLNAIPYEDRGIYLEGVISGSQEDVHSDEVPWNEHPDCIDDRGIGFDQGVILSECKKMSQHDYAKKAEALLKQSLEARKAPEEHVEEDGSNVVELKAPQRAYRPNECYSAKQVARKLGFGSGVNAVAPMYRSWWKTKLGAFQIGSDLRKGTKLYFPKEIVDAFVNEQSWTKN